MPVNVAKSGLMAKLGAKLKTAHEKHKNDETELGNFGDLPAGIENGIAQLIDCRFDTYKKGEGVGQYFFYAAGVVKLPTEHGGVPVEGLRTSIMEPLYDTPTRTRKTIDEHLQWIYNELRKLGVDTRQMKFEDLEPTVAALKEAQPHFRFRTWKGEKQTTGKYAGQEPRVQHTWGGAVEYNAEANPAGGITEAADEPADAADVMDEMDKGGDLDSLGKRADAGDEKAQVQLTELAIAEGITEDEVQNSDSWAAVVELIRAAEQGGGGGDEPAGDEEPTPTAPPKVGEVFGFEVQVKNPKTKAVTTKKVEVEVTAVNVKSTTVDLKAVGNPKVVYKGVSWDQLEELQ